MSGDVFADGEARILDRGFRNFEGTRSRWQPVRTVVVHSVQRGLGLRRAAAAKFLPFLAIAVSFLPAIVLVGMAGLFRGGAEFGLDLPTYSDYFGSISLAVILLTSLVAPEVFGNDQRNGMLGIYLASPLTRTGYLASKTAGVAAILATITAGPQLLLLVANTIQGVGPDGVGDWLLVFLRIVASGVVVSALLTALSVAVTVATNNKGLAIAVIVIVLLVVTTMASGLAEASESEGLRALSILELVLSLPAVIHGDATIDGEELMSASTAWAGLVGWVVVCGAIAWSRLQRLEVTR